MRPSLNSTQALLHTDGQDLMTMGIIGWIVVIVAVVIILAWLGFIR
jgi:hypothetical protein